MTKEFVFWLVMFLWLIGGLYSNRTQYRTTPIIIVPDLLMFIAVALLGWQVFGSAIK